MRLGFAVKVLGAGGLPSHDARRHGSDPHLRVSLEYLRAVLRLREQLGRPRGLAGPTGGVTVSRAPALP